MMLSLVQIYKIHDTSLYEIFQNRAIVQKVAFFHSENREPHIARGRMRKEMAFTLFIFESKMTDIILPLSGGRGWSVAIKLVKNTGKGIFSEIC